MKYFVMQDTPELKYAPKLKNWYGKFDVRDISLDGFPKLPNIQQFAIEQSDNTTFTDVILFPFLLVSPIFKDVINLYRERCFFCNVLLTDQVKRESKMYYLPVLDEATNIEIRKKEYKDGVCISGNDESEDEGIDLNRHFFWIRDSGKRHIILSMDMAESLIRREITGLGLCEVELHCKSNDGK